MSAPTDDLCSVAEALSHLPAATFQAGLLMTLRRGEGSSFPVALWESVSRHDLKMIFYSMVVGKQMVSTEDCGRRRAAVLR